MNIKLLRNGASAQVHNPGASPVPRLVPQLGPEWWTTGWREATEPLDDRCEQVLGEIRRAWGRVRDFSDPLGTAFYTISPGERLPVELLAGILRISDEFSRTEVVLRKVKSCDSYEVHVCDSHGETIGILEPSELLDLDHWLTWCAHWILAHLRATPESITLLLGRELPGS
jgi:hypothetical protein